MIANGVAKPSAEPIFKPVFDKSWNDLPPVMHRHYANRPYSHDHVIVEGVLNVMCQWYLRPLFRTFGTVPPYNEAGVPVTVHFTSEPDSEAFCFDRVFHFRNQQPFHFRSRMFRRQQNEIMEVMNHGICWHSYYEWNGIKVRLRHKGYSLRLCKINIPLPITWLIGRGDAEEIAVNDERFDMCATITHPLLGKVYEYKGQFKVIKEA